MPKSFQHIRLWTDFDKNLYKIHTHSKRIINLCHLIINQTNYNIDFSSEVSTLHQFAYIDEALLLVIQQNFQLTRIQELEYINQTAHWVHTNLYSQFSPILPLGISTSINNHYCIRHTKSESKTYILVYQIYIMLHNNHNISCY